MARVAVIGLGRIGLRSAWELKSLGYSVVGVDASSSAVERAERLLGVEGLVADVSNIDGLRASVRDSDFAVVALPGPVGYRVTLGLAMLGVDVVDVSFFPEDPYGELDSVARRRGATVVVDAGVAPGLSNLLVGVLVGEVGAGRARILVGGVSADPSAPLGLAATWSVVDLIDEYLRRARLVRGGVVESVEPLSRVIRVTVPGVGEMEGIPTDGLRTLLRNLRGMEELVEYTLRWPGHARAMRELLSLGLLDEQPLTVGGCSVSPRSLLARLIESKLTGYKDMVVLAVEAWGPRGYSGVTAKARPDGDWSAMSVATAGFQAAVADLLARGRIRRPGVVAPEELAGDKSAVEHILGHLARRGVEFGRLEKPLEVTEPKC